MKKQTSKQITKIVNNQHSILPCQGVSGSKHMAVIVYLFTVFTTCLLVYYVDYLIFNFIILLLCCLFRVVLTMRSARVTKIK